ncbi:MAG: universal stress protein [Bacillota bacterium]
MKILVCTDGSQPSLRAVERAADIAEGMEYTETAIIYVYEDRFDPASSFYEVRPRTKQDTARLKKLQDMEKATGEKILHEAKKIFDRRGLEVRTVIKQGHLADTIVKTAAEEGFEMIVLGSRGFGGLKKILLGSVSNAVVQEAENCMVVVVK